MPDLDPVLNRALLPGNTCFGCGHHNAAGLHIDVVRDPEEAQVLRGRFEPTADMIGFPGIVHGGAIFTALDCLSTWVAIVLGPNREAAWVLRSASAVYHNPARVGEALALTGRIVARGRAWDPLTVQTEAVRPDGAKCVEGEFKVVPLSQERFARIAGIAQMPENWRALLSHGD